MYSIRIIAEEFKTDDEVKTETKDADVTEEVYIFWENRTNFDCKLLVEHPQECFNTLWKSIVVRIPKSMKSMSEVACDPRNSRSKLVRFS